MTRIYLDNNATTGVDPRVLEAMLPELSPTPNNPSSLHYFGQEARNRLQGARDQIASFLKVKSHEILFTSSGTEAMNLLLKGSLPHQISGHAISSNIEHSSLHNTLLDLEKKGMNITFLEAGLSGCVTPEQIQQAIRPETHYIALSAVNSETGVRIDLDQIAAVALKASIPLLIDSVALLGKELFHIPPGVSGMAFSGHKIHGPKGTGFVFVRSSHKLLPQITGGGQEYSLRSGTENLPGIMGMAKAVELLRTELPTATHRMARLRDRLEEGLKNKAVPIVVNGTAPRICNTTNLSFPEITGEDLLIALDMAGIAVSHGSACSSGSLEPSRILTSMGLPYANAKSALRFSLSRNTTEEEIDQAIDIISTIANRLR
jgi:cysteine desulfurase